MTLIKTIPSIMVASLSLSVILSFKEFARNSFLVFAFAILIIFLLSVVEIIKFGKSSRKR